MEKYTLGNLEYAFKFVDADGNETVGVSTTAMWARAQEKLDRDQKAGEHTKGYITQRYVDHIALMTAKSLGLVEDDELTLENVAVMLNRYTVTEISDEYNRERPDEDAENPTPSDQEGGQEAE